MIRFVLRSVPHSYRSNIKQSLLSLSASSSSHKFHTSTTLKMPSGLGCFCKKHEHSSVQDMSASLKAAAGFSEGGKKFYAPDLRIEPHHIECNLNLDIPNHRAKAKIVHTLRVHHSSRSLQLNAMNFKNLRVEDVTGGEEDHAGSNPLSFAYDGRIVSINWAHDLAPNTVRKISVTYDIDSPVDGLLFFSPDARDSKSSVWAVTDHETERARYWLATVDYPTVRTTFDFFLTGPSAYTAVANGLLQAERPADESLLFEGQSSAQLKTTHWKLDYPCPSYICCFAIGELIRVDHGEVDGIPLAYYAPKGYSEESLLRTFQETPNVIRFLTKKLQSPFPFPKYYQIVSPGIGGAMENISFATFDPILLMDQEASREYQLVQDSVNLHEAAHSYFGDAVVMRHFEHAWLKESWATFMEAEWITEAHGAEEGRWELVQQMNQYFEEVDNSYARPIVTREYDSSWHIFDYHTYPGGSWRLNMLKHLLGEDSFWNGVRDYIRVHSRRTVETIDFQRSLEHASGRNLTRFFDQWFYGKGYPKLKGEFSLDADRKVLRISMEQTQVNKESGIGLFDFDLEVEVVLEGQQEAVKLVLPFNSESNKASATISLPSGAGIKATRVRFDPSGKVLCKVEEMNGLGEAMLKSAMNESEDVFNRIWASEQLAKLGSKNAVEAIVDAALNKERFYGVRVAMLKALTKHKNCWSVPAAAKVFLAEKDDKSLWTMAVSIRSIRDEAIRAALLEFLARPNLPPRAHARALEALGAQRYMGARMLPQNNGEDDFDIILRHTNADERRPLALVRAGGLRALGLLHNERALDMLKTRALPGNDYDDVRNVAVEAFAELVSSLESEPKKAEAVAFLRTMLRDKTEKVRFAAQSGLVKLKAAEAASDVESSKAQFAEQDHASIDRRVRTLKRSGGAGEAETSKLRKDLEDTQSKLRKLEEQMQMLLDERKAAAASASPAAASASSGKAPAS